jgi:D-inositol-3-phosphate glycosyltransferase
MTTRTELTIGLLTGGDDPHYAHGLTEALTAKGIGVEFVGSDRLDSPGLRANPLVRFLNLRGDQREDASRLRKVRRLLTYYARLVTYAATTRAPLLHILWNNKFEHIDRTLLMLLYRLCGKKVTLTAHNVNAARRDGHDSAFNRLTLRVQYALCHHVFVHSPAMKAELLEVFGVAEQRVSVIPYGLNTTTPDTALTPAEARAQLGLAADERVALAFGQIARYKGFEYLLPALERLYQAGCPVRLVLAGKVKVGHEDYWADIDRMASTPGVSRWLARHVRFIGDEEIEVFFKAADVVVLPYTSIFQSGIPFLAYAYGVPVVAADVGALREDVVEGITGLVCRSRDVQDLAKAIGEFFESPMYREREARRPTIRRMAEERHSWATVATITRAAYDASLGATGVASPALREP